MKNRTHIWKLILRVEQLEMELFVLQLFVFTAFMTFLGGLLGFTINYFFDLSNLTILIGSVIGWIVGAVIANIRNSIRQSKIQKDFVALKDEYEAMMMAANNDLIE